MTPEERYLQDLELGLNWIEMVNQRYVREIAAEKEKERESQRASLPDKVTAK